MSAAPPIETAPVAAKAAACWSEAGVWGRGDCPELVRHIHCRNCPSYSAAAVRMLDSEVPAGFQDEWTAHYARPKTVVPTDTRSVTIFRVNAEWMAIEVESLIEVIERRPVHSLPHTRSPFLKGVVNVRGQLLLCVSLTKMLNLAERSEAEKMKHTTFERMLVIDSEGGRVVFPVSEVFGLWRFAASELRDVPATVSRADAHFTKAVLPWRNIRRASDNSSFEFVSVGLLDEKLLFQNINLDAVGFHQFARRIGEIGGSANIGWRVA